MGYKNSDVKPPQTSKRAKQKRYISKRLRTNSRTNDFDDKLCWLDKELPVPVPVVIVVVVGGGGGGGVLGSRNSRRSYLSGGGDGRTSSGSRKK